MILIQTNKSQNNLKEFNSFSEAFSYLVDKSGHKQSYFYHQIGMDPAHFAKYYTNEIKNPQGDTRNKLNELVGNRIIKKGKKWTIITHKDPESQGIDDENPKIVLDQFFDRIFAIHNLYKEAGRQITLSSQQKEELYNMTKARIKELLNSF